MLMALRRNLMTVKTTLMKLWTQPVIPSDAEIDAQWRESVEKHETTAAFVRDFARALQAKWGTPPQISESDTDYWVRNRALILQAIEERGFRLVSSGGLFWLHGPSTQAQAGAVPLTDEQIVGVMHSIPINAAPSYHIAFARAIEQAHGIGIKNGDSHA